MVTNVELNSKFEALSKDLEGVKTSHKQLSEKVNSMDANMKQLDAKIDAEFADLRASIANLTALVLGNRGKENTTNDPSGSSCVFQQQIENTPQTPMQRVQEQLRLNDVDRGARLEVVDFHGDHNPETFLDWVHSLESYFRWYRLTDERKLLFANAKLKGVARIWWMKYQQDHYAVIHTWEDMRVIMNRYFIPPNYKQRVYTQFTELVQGSMTVEEYTSKFYNLATRSEFPGNEDVLISMYRRGLNPQISCGLAASRIHSMADAIQIACQMEEEVRKKTPVRPSADTLTRSERTFVDPIRGKFFDQSRVSSSVSNRSEGSSNNVATPSNNTARMRCFNCQGKGHQSRDCPSPRQTVAMVNKESEALEPDEPKLDEQVVDPLEADFSDEDLDAVGIIHPLLTATKQDIKSNNKLYQRGKIFQTRVNCNGQVCSLVIDTGSCTNVVSEEAVKKLGLQVESHPEPYHVAWITNTKLKVDKRCPVTFTIGKLKETVMCDVLPLKICHILLGRTWLWDRDVVHAGRDNTYSFVEGTTKYTLTCVTDSRSVKLKRSSLLIQRLPPADGILGRAPTSNINLKIASHNFWSKKCPW